MQDRGVMGLLWAGGGHKNAQWVIRTTGGVERMQKMTPSGIIAHLTKR